jgi:hypothetical protein
MYHGSPAHFDNYRRCKSIRPVLELVKHGAHATLRHAPLLVRNATLQSTENRRVPIRRPSRGVSMKFCQIAVFAALLALVFGCKSSGDSSGSPTSPTAPTPTGCSGAPVSQIELNFNAPGTVQVFGETFDIQQASGQAPFKITRSVVPCGYEVTGQIRDSARMIMGFGRTSPFSGQGGVERASIVIDQGNGVFESPCVVMLGGPSGPDFRIRFRVGSVAGC